MISEFEKTGYTSPAKKLRVNTKVAGYYTNIGSSQGTKYVISVCAAVVSVRVQRNTIGL